MLFNSLTFIVFFIVILSLYYLVNSWRPQKIILLLASYLFYAAWNPPLVLLLWLSTLVDWYAAREIEKAKTTLQKKSFLFLSLLVNLGLLFFFKYGNFFLENFQQVLSFLGYNIKFAKFNILLPVGISFYTFQTLSYTLDVYKGNLKTTSSKLDFALYVTFFPQLVAGPIVRAIDFLPQCVKPKRANLRQFSWGIFLMTLGLFQKVVLADTFLAPAADTVFNWHKGPLAFTDSWIGTLAFSGQIFFDFAGYSITAIGAAFCFGFILPDNFRFPYSAIGFSNFWTRWHISLSSWLRDYLYIPLGGGRVGLIKTFNNLLITMFLGGLWHGAAWTFVLWGILHAFYLILEHAFKSLTSQLKIPNNMATRSFARILTYFLVCLSWVLFRANDLKSAKLLFLSMFGIIPLGAQVLPSLEMIKVLIVIPCLLAVHWYLSEKNFELTIEKLPRPILVALWTIMLFTLTITQGSGDAFIYFQF